MNNHLSNKDKLIEDWKNAQDALSVAKEREKELREMIIEVFSEETNEMASGTESIDVGFGFDLKIEHKLNYKLTCDNDGVDELLDKIENSVEGGNVIAERLVTWKPSFNVSEYKKLEPVHKAMVDKVLEIKPAAKSVKLHKRGN